MDRSRAVSVAFILVPWLLGRLIVVAGFLGAPHVDLTAVANWDGIFYRAIATSGYEYAADGLTHTHSIAFFPLYPLLVSLVMKSGVGFYFGALLVNNACFLAMLFVTYGWIAERNGINAARWTVAFLALFPLSLFGTVAYSEGTFMLLTALTLRDFDRGKYGLATLWSACASLARPNGFLLLPALAAAAAYDRRGYKAFFPALGAAIGIAAVVTFSAWRFGDPLAFFHAEQAWRPGGAGYGMYQWGVLLTSGSTSFGHWIFQLPAAAVVAVLFFAGARLHWAASALLWSLVIAIEELAWGRDFSFATIAFLGGAALVYFRRELGAATVTYGLLSLAAFLLSATVISVDRYLYGVLPFSLAIGLVLQRLPALAPALLFASTIDLYRSSAAFARSLWVA
ncbi:MAG TPA: mannosyltransferase family protein [Candidatus Acidoferrales bacterium]|nr:mannosyltransferase family protein [Candidatus Acidoferrales bacterium]